MNHECYDNGVSGALRRCQEMILKHAPGLMKTGDMANKPGLVRWSDKDKARLRRMYDNKVCIRDAANTFERSYQSVHKVFRRWDKEGAK